jgi:hypothetical protein
MAENKPIIYTVLKNGMNKERAPLFARSGIQTAGKQ